MSTYREVLTKSNEIYRQNGLISHIIYFFLSILAGAFILLGIFYVDLLLLIVPFVLIPLIFASHIITISLRNSELLTFKGFMRSIFIYYSPKFSSTFRVIKNALWTLIMYASSLSILLILVNLLFYFFNYHGYASIYQSLYNSLATSYESFYNVLAANETFVNEMLIFVEIPTLFLSSFFYLYLTTKSSISLFIRTEPTLFTGKFCTYLNAKVLRNNRKEITPLFIKLNWPLFVLFILGFAGGVIVGYLVFKDYGSIFSISLAISIILSFGVYGPRLESNNEAIYLKYKEKYLEESDKYLKSIDSSLQAVLEQIKELEKTKKDSNESE